MKTIIFCLILLIFYIKIHEINALECYSCVGTEQNTTECHDKFNGASIDKINVTTTDARCVKITGKLSNNLKFTLRTASSNGCLKELNVTEIIENGTDLTISDSVTYCCNKHLCNQVTTIQSNFFILILFTIIAIFFVFE